MKGLGTTLIYRLIWSAALIVAATQSVWSAPAEDSARVNQMRALADRLKYETGEVRLGNGLATVKLTDEFRYLNPAGAETVVTGIWGNPPSTQKPLGMIVPAGFDPFAEKSWAVIITYDDDGYIKDNDANTIDYNDLLNTMKEGAKEASKERVKQGYPEIELVGWATPPNYDATTHKFVWAKEIKFGGSDGDNTLNYNLRILGRGGVLVLNAVSSMSDLSAIQQAAPKILSMVDFEPGKRYTDYKPGSDKVATYGLAALVAGGVATKTGLLKGLLVGALAMKKFLVIGAIAVFAILKKVLGRKSQE